MISASERIECIFWKGGGGGMHAPLIYLPNPACCIILEIKRAITCRKNMFSGKGEFEPCCLPNKSRFLTLSAQGLTLHVKM